MFTPRSTPNQMRSMPSFSHGAQQRHHDERQLEEVEEEGEQEDEDVDDDEEAQLPARQVQQQVLDPHVPVHAVEGEAEDARADEDEHHEGRQPRGRLHRLAGEPEREPPAHERHDERSRRAHRSALGGRSPAEEDRAQHEEDEAQGRDQHEDHLRTSAEKTQLVARPGSAREGGPAPAPRRVPAAVQHASMPARTERSRKIAPPSRRWRGTRTTKRPTPSGSEAPRTERQRGGPRRLKIAMPSVKTA